MLLIKALNLQGGPMITSEEGKNTGKDCHGNVESWGREATDINDYRHNDDHLCVAPVGQLFIDVIVLDQIAFRVVHVKNVAVQRDQHDKGKFCLLLILKVLHSDGDRK